jgi:GxxExxY protein
MHENEIGTAIIASSMRVHSALGPGLLESVYELCLEHELTLTGLSVRRQVDIPLRYKDIEIDHGYRLDILVADRVVVEAKVLDTILPVHRSQLLSYLRLGGFKLGYLMNFNVAHMRNGIVRLVNGL